MTRPMVEFIATLSAGTVLVVMASKTCFILAWQGDPNCIVSGGLVVWAVGVVITQGKELILEMEK